MGLLSKISVPLLHTVSKYLTTGVTATALMTAMSLQPFTYPLMVGSAWAQSTSKNYLKINRSNASKINLVHLGRDKSLVVDLPADANDVLVANPKVADAVMRTSRRIYLFGKQIGQTNIFIFDGQGRQIAALDILIERDISGLEDSIARFVKYSNVKAEMINDNVVLTGTVRTPADAAKAVSLAQIFVQGGEQSGGNDSQSAGSGSGFTAVFGGDTDKQSSIVNLLKIEGEDQVQLKVVIAEVQRAVTKQLGISTSYSGNNGIGFTGFGRGTPQQIISSGGSSASFGFNGLQSQLRAMEVAGVVRTLAEPTLTAISGEQADFKVGGTWQTPQEVTNNDDGSTAVTFKELPYGISLSFTPVVLTEGRISLKLRTEVQEPSSTGAATLRGDVNASGTRNRSASTTIELPSGGSMAIAGLVKDDIRQVISGVPGLSKIPILGTLFRSREFIREETELVIIVTPYLVRPTARKNLAQPDENFQPASDSASVFMGRVNRVYGTKQGNIPKGRYTGSIGFILK